MSLTVSTPRGMISLRNTGTSGSLGYNEQEGFSYCNEVKLLSVTWNQDCSCFAAGTSHGFHVYTCRPFKETFSRMLENGRFKIVEMLFRCNIFALVGGGIDNSQYPPNKVWIWDDHQNRCLCELAFRSEVHAVKLRRDYIVVVLEQKIYVYDFKDLKVRHQLETVSNPQGLCCVSHHSNKSLLACPGLHQGQVRIEDLGRKRIRLINAHDSVLACMALTLDGSLLATASTKGTLIRIFNTVDGTLLQEVRRGADRAEIYSIAISLNAQWLAVSSDRGTVHVFSLKTVNQGLSNKTLLDKDSSNSPSTGTNPGSPFSFMRGVFRRYFSSERSFAQFTLPEATRYIAAFGSQNTVLLVGLDGRFFRCSFDPVFGGQMVELENCHFPETEMIRSP